MAPELPLPRTAALLTISVLITVLAACGSAPGSPRETPVAASALEATPTPEPTPSPDDIKATFLAFARGPENVPMEVEYSGRIVGDQIDFAFNASLKDAGEDEAYEGDFTIDGETENVRNVRIGTDVYQQTGDGPWLASAEGIYTYDLHGLFEDLIDLSFIDVHQETEGPCWRYRADPMEMPAGLFQLAVSSAGDLTFTTTRYEVEVDAQGLPMSLEIDADVSFLIDGAEMTAAAEYRYAFSNVGGQIALEGPAEGEVWGVLTDDTMGFSIAHPPTMQPMYDAEGYWWITDGQQFVHVKFYPVGGVTGAAAANRTSDDYYGDYVSAAAAREELIVGGEVAYMSTYEWDDDGVPATGWLLIVPADGGFFLLDCWGPTSNADEMRATFDQMISTFRLVS